MLAQFQHIFFFSHILDFTYCLNLCRATEHSLNSLHRSAKIIDISALSKVGLSDLVRIYFSVCGYVTVTMFFALFPESDTLCYLCFFFFFCLGVENVFIFHGIQ